jgi:hypothetical protein
MPAARETLARISMLVSSEAMCSSGRCKLPPPSRKGSSNGTASSSVSSTPTKVPELESDPSTPILPKYNSSQRDELNAIIKTFIVAGSEKELNIPPRLRKAALVGLQNSADPVHLASIAEHVYQLLRNCSHRNFVRLGVSNGTFETICVATSLGIVLTIAGFLCVLLRAFTPFMGAHSRWDAFAAWPMWWLGISLILSGLRGSCFFLLLFSRRQPLPWERFDDSSSASDPTQRTGIMKILSRLMIFDRKFKVTDAHLRRLQHKIVIQSLVGGAMFATASVLLFVLLPIWSETVAGSS